MPDLRYLKNPCLFRIDSIWVIEYPGLAPDCLATYAPPPHLQKAGAHLPPFRILGPAVKLQEKHLRLLQRYNFYRVSPVFEPMVVIQ